MSGRYSRNKGARFEREVVNFAKSKGYDAKRVPLSGATWMKSDVLLNVRGNELRCECKKRGKGWKQIYAFIEGNNALVIGADHKEPLIIMRLTDWMYLNSL